jgi:hypothetical protein
MHCRVGPVFLYILAKLMISDQNIWNTDVTGIFYHNFNRKIVAKLSSQLATDASL